MIITFKNIFDNKITTTYFSSSKLKKMRYGTPYFAKKFMLKYESEIISISHYIQPVAKRQERRKTERKRVLSDRHINCIVKNFSWRIFNTLKINKIVFDTIN